MGHSLKLYIFKISEKLEKKNDTNSHLINNVSQCNTSDYLIYIIKNIYLTVNTILSCIYNLMCIPSPRYLQHTSYDISEPEVYNI